MNLLIGNRNWLIITSAIAVVIILAASIFFLAGKTATPVNPDNVITVAATIFPLADIAQNIGGEYVRVVQLLPPGATPHSYTLTPQQLSAIQQAKSLFIIGHGLDGWTQRAVSKVADIPTVTVDQNIQLREFGELRQDEHAADGNNEELEDHDEATELNDPHYWLTVPNAKTIAKTITQNLQQIDPSHGDQYANNLRDYLVKLDLLENELQTLAKQSTRKDFMAIHDAWSYFANHYGLKLAATYEPVEGRNPTINEIRELQNIIQEHNLGTFFTEPQKQSTSATRFLKDDMGLNIKILDPVGGLGNRDSYINTMRENMIAIVE